MAWAAGAVIEVVVLLTFTAWLVNYYASRDVSWLCRAVVYFSWLFGFAGTLLLPIDIGESYEAKGYVDLMKTFWVVVYWATFILAWVIIPVLQEYSAAGQFTVRGRLLASLRANLKFILAMLVAGIVFVIWMLSAGSITVSDAPNFMLTLANTYGLCLIIVMMGYGLVEVPRTVWRASVPEAELRRLQFGAAEMDAALFDARCALDEVIEEISATKRVLPGASIDPEAAEMHSAMAVILEIMPPASERFHSRTSTPVRSGDEVTLTTLATLNARLKYEKARFSRAQHRWDQLLERCAVLEQLIAGTVPPSAANAAASTGQSRVSLIVHNVVWRWRLHCAGFVYKFIAGLCLCMSLLVLWAEVVMPFSSNDKLSPFGYVVKHSRYVGARQLTALVPLMYMCWCTYLAPFRLKLFESLELTGNRQTEAFALLFNATYLCRLQFSLAFNYLAILRLSKDTAYEQSVGKNMELIPHLNQYIPILLLLFALATLFNAFERLMRLVGVEQRGSPRSGHPDDEDTIQEGVALIRKARHRTHRGATTHTMLSPPRDGRPGGGAGRGSAGRGAGGRPFAAATPGSASSAGSKGSPSPSKPALRPPTASSTKYNPPRRGRGSGGGSGAAGGRKDIAAIKTSLAEFAAGGSSRASSGQKKKGYDRLI